MVKESRKLKIEKAASIQPLQTVSGRSISIKTIEIIQQFYLNDEVSRILPGKKDFVSMKVDNIRVHKQKRLLLMNLNELHQAFKNNYSDIKIGISKFCELRPKNCITVGSHDSLSVCVCKIHQNVKLMIAALTLSEKVTHHGLKGKDGLLTGH